MSNLKVSLDLPETDVEVLILLGWHSYLASVDPGELLQLLIDHVLDGGRRPGSWEPGWISQIFGDDWEASLIADENAHMQVRSGPAFSGTNGRRR